MIINNDIFLEKEIPQYHPLTQKSERLKYWAEFKRRCMEGYWQAGKWMPPELYWYLNAWNIQVGTKSRKNSGKIIGRPWFRDLEWEKAYIASEAFGFSGFELDNKYTCYYKYAPENIEDSIKDGDVTEEEARKIIYLKPRDYLNKYHGVNLGKALYLNQAKNVIDIEARGCLAKGTKVLMFDGTTKNIEDVVVGDLLIGKDGTFRTVLETHNGVDQLYKIQHKNNSFDDLIVNSKHRVSIKKRIYVNGKYVNKVRQKGTNKIEYTNLTIKELLNSQHKPSFTNNHYRYKPTKPILFSETKTPKIDCYYFGLWLADGRSNCTSIKITDSVLWNYLKDFAKTNNINYRETIIKKENNRKEAREIYYKDLNLRTQFKNYDLIYKEGRIPKKQIPLDFLQSSVENRLALLAGIIDGDGNFDKDRLHLCITVGVDKELGEQYLTLIRSLGFSASLTSRNRKNWNTCYTVRLNGDLSKIPLKLKRKIVQKIKHRIDLNSSSFKITDAGIGEYYGLLVDKDHEYLLSDFSIDHNSGKSFWGAALIAHNFLFDGSHDYDEYLRLKKLETPMVSQTLVGAIQASYSNDLLNKFKLGIKYLPGQFEFYGQKYPSPLAVSTEGSLEAGKKPLVSLKSKSELHHRTFQDNPQAGNGTRPSRVFLEEIGFFNKLIEALGSLKDVTYDSAFKFGTIWMFGCVCAGTKVWTNDGKRINIEDLQKENGIIGYEGNGVISQEIEDMKPPAKKPCLRITTTSNKILECSIDHPLLWSKNKWGDKNKYTTFKRADELKVGEQLMTLPQIPVFTKSESTWYPRILGMLVGDGHYGGRSVELSVDSDDVFNYLKSLPDLILYIDKEYKLDNGNTFRRIFINSVQQKLRDAGIMHQSKDEKTLPKNILNYNFKDTCEFLGGYFDADGSVYYNEKKDNTRIILTSKYKSLLDDVQVLLLKLGIDSTIREEFRKTGYQPGIIYRLYINRKKDIISFHKYIRFINSDKQSKLDNAVKNNSKSRFTYDSCKFIKSESTTKGQYYLNNDIELKGLSCETIKSIEDIGEQTVYNLRVSTTHTYLTNEFISGNTGGDMEGGSSLAAQEVFYNPEAYDCLIFEDEWENRGKIGYFVPYQKALNDFKEGPNLITNMERATDYANKRREKAKKSNSPRPYNDELQNNPMKPSEAFLVVNENKFPLKYLEESYVNLTSSESQLASHWVGRPKIDTEGKLKWENIDAHPCRIWPVKNNALLENVVELFEMPKRDNLGNVTPMRYIGGTDPVDDDGIDGSLQSSFIMDLWTERIVAEYTTRTDNVEDYWETFRLLLIMFNAQSNYENQKKGLYGHFKNKNSLHLLADTPKILQDLDLAMIKGDGNKSKGTYASANINLYGRKLYNIWLKKQAVGKPEGVVNAQTLRSLGAVIETMNYNPNGNFDRISALEKLFILYADRIQLAEGSRESINEAAAGLAADPFFSKNYDRWLNKNKRSNFVKINTELKTA
jgi:hypothetical protein